VPSSPRGRFLRGRRERERGREREREREGKKKRKKGVVDLSLSRSLLLLLNSQKDRMSEELAAVSRRMDEIVAQAAAQGALDEQFTQLRELEVRRRLGERKEGREKEEKGSSEIGRTRGREREPKKKKLTLFLSIHTKNFLLRTSPTRTLSPRSPRSTSPTPRRSSISSRRPWRR
jgi:hypothetical protein